MVIYKKAITNVTDSYSYNILTVGITIVTRRTMITMKIASKAAVGLL